MKYEISTVSELKAAIFDAIEKGVVLDKAALSSFEAFYGAIWDYTDMCMEAKAISPDACVVSIGEANAWYKELKAAPVVYGVGLVIDSAA